MSETSSTPRRAFLSLGLKLTAPVVLLVLATALLVYWGLVRQERAALMHAKEVAASMVVKLTAVSVAPALDFDDDAEIQREVKGLALNPEITDVAVWTADAKQPSATFHRGAPRPLPREAGQRVASDTEVMLTHAITDPEGKPIGVLAVRFSTDREARELARLARQSLYVAFAASLALAGAILFAISRLAIRPLRRLQQAAVQLSRGERRGDDLGVARSGMDDEVRQLAATFAVMAAAVTDREDKLAARNADLKLVLDSVQQGFLTANRDGSLRPQRSAILETWFPGLPAHLTFSEFIAQIDPSRHAWTDLAWEQVTAGVIPLEVAIDQLPQHLVRQGRHFEVEHHPLVQDGALVQVGIVVSDVTAEIERARAAAEQQEFSVLVDQFVRDRRAFGEFWHEAASLVARVTAEEASVASGIKRDLHTLKGNARFYGLARLSSLIHRIEDALAERQGDALLAEERVEIADLWGGLERRMEPITREGASRIEITEAEQQALLRAIAARQPHAAIEKLVRELSHEPTSRRLEWAKAIVLEACQKLGKPVPEVQIDHHDLRLPAERWALFWNTLPHVLRNLADHGIDLEAERVAAGKPAVCTVRLSTAIDRRDLVVKVEDDGRGIDWDRVRDQAAAMSLPHATQADLEAALLHEGLSTRQTTTDLSGRGVGLSAVRAVVESLGGTMALESRAGQGTAWTFRLPMG